MRSASKSSDVDPVVKDRRRRRRIMAWSTMAVALVGLVAYGVWSATAVRADLVAAQDHARALERAVMDGDDTAIDRELSALRERSDSARSRVGGPVWSVGAVLPIVGDDVDAVREISSLIGDLVEDGLTTLIESGTTLRPEAFAPQNGRVPLESVEELAQGVELAAPSFADAGRRVRAIDVDGLIGPVETQVTRLRDELLPVTDLVGVAARAVPVMPAMLGQDEERRYLVVVQNNAELRATGGLLGAAAELSADGGRLSMSEQVAPGQIFGELDEPVLPLTPAELTLYDRQLGTYFQDVNFTPDFPRSAELARAFWAREYPARLDGVLSVDPIALSYLLRATGPIESAGRTLTSDNVVDTVLNDIYLTVENPVVQNEVFAEITSDVFDALTTGEIDARAFLDGVSRAAREGRILLHAFDQREQEAVADTRMAGELRSADTGDAYVDLSINDATASKLSYYVTYDVEASSRECSDDGEQLIQGRAIFSSSVPEGGSGLTPSILGPNRSGFPDGSQLLIVRLHAPVDGEIVEVAVDRAVAQGAAMATEKGRPAGVYTVFLDPGDRIEMTWTMRSGPGQAGDILTRVTPGTRPVDESHVALSSCD